MEPVTETQLLVNEHIVINYSKKCYQCTYGNQLYSREVVFNIPIVTNSSKMSLPAFPNGVSYGI